MAEVRKLLGSAATAAATPKVLYTVPALTEAIVSVITVCNTNLTAGGAAKFRINVGVSGLADEIMYYDQAIAINTTQVLKLGLCLAAGTIITVRSDTADLVFKASGVEIS